MHHLLVQIIQTTVCLQFELLYEFDFHNACMINFCYRGVIQVIPTVQLFKRIDLAVNSLQSLTYLTKMNLRV